MYQNDPHCMGCFYYQQIHSGMRCCHYLLIRNEKRPCDPGKDCTVKTKWRTKKKEAKYGSHE